MNILIYNLVDSPMSNPYAQIVGHKDGLIYDYVHRDDTPLVAFADLAGYDDSVVPLTEVSQVNGWGVPIPTNVLPSGDYHLVLKDNAVPADTDRVVDFVKFTIAGGAIVETPKLMGRVL